VAHKFPLARFRVRIALNPIARITPSDNNEIDIHHDDMTSTTIIWQVLSDGFVVYVVPLRLANLGFLVISFMDSLSQGTPL
jgi:hypothetical protein